MYKNILVPIDMRSAEHQAKVIATATDLAKLYDARVHMIFVAHKWPENLSKAPSDYREPFEAFAAEQAKKAGIAIAPIFRVGGSVSGHIRSAAEDLDADLIVMSSHDPGLADYLIGSNAAHVVLHAECSVFVVR